MTTSSSRRWWALIAISVSVLVVGLDLTVLTLALPTLSRALHASASDLQWFTDAYSLVLAAAMLPAGLLGDRLGRKKVLLASLALFGAGSAACAYSASAGELIAARALLGLGAAAIMPLSLAVLPVLFTSEERTKAIAVVMGATFIAFPAGPLLGGWLLDSFWWGSVFLINVPVAVLALIAVAVLMPESRSERRPRLDVTGVAISSAGLAGLTYGFIRAGGSGWTDAAALAAMIAGAAVLGAFVAWERRVSRRFAAPGATATATRGAAATRPARSTSGTTTSTADTLAAVPVARAAARDRATATQPLVDLSLFRSAGFTWGTILATLVSFAMFGIFYAMPQFFQDVRGLDALGSGIRLLPLIGGMVVGMLAGAKLQTVPGNQPGGTPPVSARTLVAAGFAVMTAALAAGAFTRTSSGASFTAAWFAVAGLGLGLAMPTTTNAALDALTAERSGSGSAVISALRQVGATIGVAILGTVLSSGYQGHLHPSGLPPALASAARSSVAAGVEAAHALRLASLLDAVRTAFTHGLDSMLWVCAGIAVASALLALAFLPRRSGAVAAPPAGGGSGGTAARERAELSHEERAER
jgi:DHA2 family multidrug resistance protein-like MFS transporter